ncbi:GGDEF domain-containing protein [Falsigemmobacter faecalis]|uniref:diguanylate cyclase n=2 Tax=Falsigemmobacter faecalis TaxID=2488730 RepID=A0A3P3DRE0_9RHOB|nr:GGDEF domain-containing protein [Falsigemmobacter faecalis]
MPVIIAFPLAFIAFTWIERLEQAYASLLKEVRELGRQASTDPLTGLLNRRSFEKQFDSAMQHRSGGKFIIADVDYLKAINDQHGHVIGDDAILACATAMSQVLGDECLIARIGGDEFCAFLPLGAARSLQQMSVAINEAADRDFKLRSRLDDVTVSISVGMAPCPPGSSFREIMARTDSDLYRKKIRRPER